MSEPGWSRFRPAIIASGVVRLLALIVLVGGVLPAVWVLQDHHLKPLAREVAAGALVVGATVPASFLAIVGYLIPVLVAIYDEVRTPRFITQGPPVPNRHIGPSFGYTDPAPPR